MRPILLLAGAVLAIGSGAVQAQTTPPTTDASTTTGTPTAPDSGIAAPNNGMAKPDPGMASPGSDASATGSATPTDTGTTSPTMQGRSATPSGSTQPGSPPPGGGPR